MIISKLKGGLGNQMFQYAIGRQLSLLNKDNLFLDKEALLNNTNLIYTKRDYELNIFKLSSKDLNFNNLTKFINKIKQKIKPLKIIIESSSEYNKSILKHTGNLLLDGYWQSEKYFKNIEYQIREDFAFKNKPNEINANILEKIRQSNSISLHIRRGDYVYNLNTNKVHGICSTEYYDQGISIIQSKVSNPQFFIFSDDIEWVKKNHRFNSEPDYIDFNKGKDSFEDMRLMSNCKHCIIANSTFSWWAAWLNTNPEKIVIAPKKWFNDATINTQDLIPETWIKI